MKLNAVHVTKTDTCLTFAFKRVGYTSEIDDIGDIQQHFELLDYFENSNNLQIGDILIFTHNEKSISLGTEMTEDGKIIFHNVLCKRHCVVYEDDGMVSDLTRSAVENSSTPSLRRRILKEIKVRPTYILRIPEDQIK